MGGRFIASLKTQICKSRIVKNEHVRGAVNWTYTSLACNLEFAIQNGNPSQIQSNKEASYTVTMVEFKQLFQPDQCVS